MNRSHEGGSPALPRVWPLVGRTAELSAIADAVGRPDVSGVVLTGEPGVGKTRLGREGLAIARQAGFTVAQAAASQAAASIPLGALAPLLPDLSADGATDAVRRAVEALGANTDDGPYMLLVDDAHLLDAASATVLHHLAADTPVFLLVTVRTGDAAPDPVAALWKDDLAVRIDVEPLDQATAEAFLTGALGAPVEGRTMSDLFRVSGGNPLFLRELVLGAASAGLLAQEEGIWRLRAAIVTSPRLTELVEARLTDLSGDERAALEVVAFGEPLALDQLLALASPSDVESLERQGLVTLDGASGRRTVVLAHPMHGEVLRANLGPLRAMAVQRRLAETLMAGGPLSDEDALRVAIWMTESDGDIPLEDVVRAAWRARFAGDDALAASLATAALNAGAGIDAAQVLGEALLARGRAEEAVDVLGGVDGLDMTEDQFALVSLTRAEALFSGLGRANDGRAVLERAMRRVDDPGWRGEILALYGTYILFEGYPLEAIQTVAPVLDSGSARAAVSAATVAAPALAIAGAGDRAVTVAERAFAQRLELGDQPRLMEAGIHIVATALAQSELGEVEKAEALARAAYESAVETRQVQGQAWLALILARTLWLRRLPESLRWFREAAALFADLDQSGQRRWCVAGGMMVAAMHGDHDAVGELGAATDALDPGPVQMMESDVMRARAWALLSAGDLQGARKRLETAATIARARGAFALEASARHDLVRIGEPESVVDRLAVLADQVDGDLVGVRARHAAALASGDAAGLEDAADRFESTGTFVLAAEAMAQAAALHRQQGGARAAQRCGQRVAELDERAGGVRTPAMALAGDAAALTRREREIAELAAQGLSNQAIADHLVVSRRTVANHLQRAYEKLGVSGRGELTSALGARPGAA